MAPCPAHWPLGLAPLVNTRPIALVKAVADPLIVVAIVIEILEVQVRILQSSIAEDRAGGGVDVYPIVIFLGRVPYYRVASAL